MAAADCPNHLRCPLTHHVFVDPVVAPSGHTFERAAIEECLTRSAVNPMTREPLSRSDLRPNYTVRDAVAAWVEERSPQRQPAEGDRAATPNGNDGDAAPPAAPQARSSATVCGAPDGVAAWLEAHGLKPHEAVKIVLLGNSGVGKSRLCDVLLGHDSFEHATQGGSVTAEVSYACTITPCGTALVVCNVPGLQEANGGNLARNKAAVTHVLAGFLPDAPTLCLFVVRSSGGRVPRDDVATMMVVRRYLGASLPPDAFAFVVNAVEFGELDEPPAEHAVSVKAEVRAALGDEQAPRHWAFVPKLPRAARRTLVVRAQLLELLNATTPSVVRPAAGTPLLLDAEHLAQARDAARAAADQVQRQRDADRAAGDEEVRRECDADREAYEEKLRRVQAEREEAERRHSEDAEELKRVKSRLKWATILRVAASAVIHSPRIAIEGASVAAVWAARGAFSAATAASGYAAGGL